MRTVISHLTPVLPAFAAVALAACAGPVEPTVAAETRKPARARSNVRQVPVPYGTKLPCTGLFNENAVGYHIGRDVAIEASDTLDSDATSLCWISERARKRKRRRAAASARVCHVTVYCSYIYDAQKEREKCSTADNATELPLGAAGCRYNAPLKVDMLDADSQCRIVVHPASGETDSATLSACASAVATEISPARLRRDGSAISAQHANEPSNAHGDPG